jgi:hypothetical protein
VVTAPYYVDDGYWDFGYADEEWTGIPDQTNQWETDVFQGNIWVKQSESSASWEVIG